MCMQWFTLPFGFNLLASYDKFQQKNNIISRQHLKTVLKDCSYTCTTTQAHKKVDNY